MAGESSHRQLARWMWPSTHTATSALSLSPRDGDGGGMFFPRVWQIELKSTLARNSIGHGNSQVQGRLLLLLLPHQTIQTGTALHEHAPSGGGGGGAMDLPLPSPPPPSPLSKKYRETR